MAMSVSNSRSALIVILAAVLMGGLSSAGWTFQEPRRTPSSEEDRKRALERITKELQERQQAAKPAPASTTQQPQPAPAQPAPAQPTPPPAAPAVPPAAASIPRESGKVLLNFDNADLYDFINQMASTLGLNPLVIDPEVKGSVNISSTGPLSKEDIMPIFTLILKNNNAALIRQSGAYQIVPISSALKRGVEIIEKLPSSGAQPETEKTPAQTPENAVPANLKDQSLMGRFKALAAQNSPRSKQPLSSTLKEPTDPKGSRLATHVIRAEFIPVKDLIEPIKLFMTEGGVIMPYERLNMLILTDYTDSVDRILQIVRMLDNNYLDPDLVELVKINNNASADIAEDLKKMFGSGSKDSATGISFISLDRLNALFVMASSRRALEEVKGWIKELDSSSAKNIQTYVYAVQNSTASNIAMMLSALYGGEGSSGDTTNTGTTTSPGGGIFGSTRSGQGNLGSGTGSGTASTPFGSQTSYGGQMGGGYGSGIGSYGGSYGGYGGYGGYGPFGAGRQLGPQLNNSRTVSSQVLRGGQFTGLQDTVRMVVDDINNSLIIQATAADYAYIAETIRKMDVLPRQALIDAKIFEVDLTDNLNFGITASLKAKGTDPNTTTGELTSAGLLTAQTFMPVGDARQIMAALEALRLKTRVKVLESPSVLALDGQQAQIVVGAEIPYPGTSFTPSVGGSTTSVQYRDTGISLIVVPRISASGSVTLDLVQEVSAPGANVPIGDSSAPSFSKTSVATTLSVKDGETVAIAGLIRDGSDTSRSGIPFLSEIPLLGALFGQTSRNSHRNELIVLITPHVIRTPEGLQEMTQELRDSLRHVRKYADEKEKEKAEDMKNAREDRYDQERKNLKKTKPAKPEAEAPKPANPETEAIKPAVTTDPAAK